MNKKSSMRVLIVDGHKTMLRIVRNIVETIGIKDIDEAQDGSVGLDLFMRKKYDLVISEWVMQPTDGLEMLKEIRSGGYNSDVPFIMMTSESQSEKVITAKEAGVTGYIVKPFNGDVMKSKIENILGL